MNIDDMWDDEEDVRPYIKQKPAPKASPASVPEGWKLVGLEDLIKTVLDADAALSRGDKNEALIGVRVAASFVSLIKSHVANRKTLAAAPTPPVEDRKEAELWRDLISHQKFNNVPAVGYAINQAKKRQAMQKDKL